MSDEEVCPAMRYELFRAGSFTTWDELMQSVADYATELGPERVVSISQSEDKGDAVVTIWYWDR
jgi:hypothetical protein